MRLRTGRRVAARSRSTIRSMRTSGGRRARAGRSRPPRPPARRAGPAGARRSMRYQSGMSVQLVVVQGGRDLARVHGRHRHAGAVRARGAAPRRSRAARPSCRRRPTPAGKPRTPPPEETTTMWPRPRSIMPRQRRLHRVDRAEPVHVVMWRASSSGSSREGAVVRDAGVRHHHVDVAELRRSPRRSESGSATSATSGTCPSPGSCAGQLVERLALACDQAERGAARRERAGDRLADPPRGARDEHASPWPDLHGSPLNGQASTRLGWLHVPGARHRRRGAVPRDHLLAPGGRSADHGREHRPGHAGVRPDRARDGRAPRGRRLRHARRRQVARVHRLRPGARGRSSAATGWSSAS